jgi:predicted alpha/beta-fold hydrolase
VLNALNDPFLPRRALPAAQQVAASVTLDYTEGGGHVGFVAGAFPGHLDWLPQRLLSFFDRAG